MPDVTAMTAAAMQAVKDAALIDAQRIDDEFIITRGDGTIINLGEFVTKEEFDEQGASGREIAFATSNTYQSGIAGTAVWLTGLSVTFTVVERPVYVEVDLPWVTASAATGSLIAIIADNAGTGIRWAGKTFIASEMSQFRLMERISLPGTYTRKVGLQRTAGTATFGNNYNPSGPTIYSMLRVVER